MKRKELPDLLNNFKSLLKLEGEYKVTYAIHKNITKLEKEVAILVEMNKASEGAIKMEQERSKEIQKYLLLDEKKKPVMVNGQTKFDESKRKEWDKFYKSLQKKYSKEIAIEKKRLEDFDAFLEEDAKFDFYMVEEKECPKLMAKEMTPVQAGALSNIIK